MNPGGRRTGCPQFTKEEGEDPMQAMVSVIYRLVVRNDAQDLTEYGLLAALIALAALAAVTTLGETIRNVLWSPIAFNF